MNKDQETERAAEAAVLEQQMARTGGRPPLDQAEARAMQDRIDADAASRARAEQWQNDETIRRLRQEHEDREALRPKPPITQAVTARAAFPDEETVRMIFPRPLFVWSTPDPENADPRRRQQLKIAFGAGVQPVPVCLKDHWYLKASGVKPLDEEDRKESTKS